MMLYHFLTQLKPSQEILLIKYPSRKAKASQHLFALITGSKVFGEKMRTSGTQAVSWTMVGKSRRWEFSPI